MADETTTTEKLDTTTTTATDATATDTAKTTGTIIDSATDKGGDDKGSTDKGDTANDWRVRLAGEDKDALKRLARFTDEAAFYKSYRSLESKLSSGEYVKPLAADATPEEKAAWRKENGFPDKPDEYVSKLELPKGFVIGEAEKPVVAELASVALESNMDPKAFNGIVSKYYEIQDKQRQALEEADANFKRESEDALREVWQGASFKENLTAVRNLTASWPEGLADSLWTGRDANGRLFGNNPELIRQLAALSLELNPAATRVPSGVTDAGKSVQARLEEIRQLRREDPNKYESDKKLQAEELELIEADLKIKKRAAA